MQITTKIARLSQDDWHCATLENIFEEKILNEIILNLSDISWTEAKKNFYIQREANLNSHDSYKSIFSEHVSRNILKSVEMFFDEEFEEKFDIVAHKMIDGDYIGIHTDTNIYGESHRLTLMLNESWTLEQGGILLSLKNNSLKNIRDAWLPIANTGFLFEITDKSYHAVTPIKGHIPRYSVIFTFKKINNNCKKKSLWSSFPLTTDLSHAISTASFIGINNNTFNDKYTIKKFSSIAEFEFYIGGVLDNAPTGFSYKNGNSINVDQNGNQSKGSDQDRINTIKLLKRIPPIIIVKRVNGCFTLVDGSHRLSFAKDNNLDLCVAFYEEK